MKKFADGAQVMKIFVPFSTHLPFFRSAVDWSPFTSEPAAGSVRAKEASHSPEVIFGM